MFINSVRLAFVLPLFWLTPVDAAESPDLGQPISEFDIQHISTTVFPDGRGLPEGSGNTDDGQQIYVTQCAHCHGAEGEGNSQFHVPALAGMPEHGSDWSVGSSWPYATSVFDYIQRAMPPYSVKQLSADQVYAVTAYILHMNALLEPGETVDQLSLPQVIMPAQQYFKNKWLDEEQFYELPDYSVVE